jgi:hypothetical protein
MIAKPLALFTMALGLAAVLSACAHPKGPHVPTEAESAPRKYRPWVRDPSLPIEDALNRALTYLRDRKVNLASGYVLEVSRADDSWWLDFLLLPRSPDYNVVVRVYDSGQITGGL